MSSNKIKYVAVAVLWFDKTNGNTYYSVQITKTSNGQTVYCPYQYGYGEHYRQTALKAMADKKWLPKEYRGKESYGVKLPKCYLYERENNYPIKWISYYSTKKECKEHGIKQ